MSFERIQSGLRWLAGEFSAEPSEFYQAHKVGGPMLLDGLLSKGYAWQKGGRVAVTDAGRRVIADTKPADAAARAEPKV